MIDFEDIAAVEMGENSPRYKNRTQVITHCLWAWLLAGAGIWAYIKYGQPSGNDWVRFAVILTTYCTLAFFLRPRSGQHFTVKKKWKDRMLTLQGLFMGTPLAGLERRFSNTVEYIGKLRWLVDLYFLPGRFLILTTLDLRTLVFTGMLPQELYEEQMRRDLDAKNR